MTAQKIIQQYESGHTTQDGLLLSILSQTSRRVVEEALLLLSPENLNEMAEFVGYYTPKTKIFNAPRPNPRTLRYVRNWFASRKQAASA